MNKKIISIFIALTISIFAQQKDVTDGLLKQKKDELLYIKNKDYPIDRICEQKYVERYILATENLIKDIKNEPEDLDFCRPYRKLFEINKRIHIVKNKAPGKRKSFEIRSIAIDLSNLVKKYNSSYYINFYAILFKKNFKKSIKRINTDLFSDKLTDYSKYIRGLLVGKNKKKKAEYFKYRKMNSKKRIYLNVKDFVQSEHNLIYLNASKDVYKYLKKYEPEKLLEFLEYEIKEHKKRNLKLNRLYLDYSILLLKENKRDTDLSEEWVLKSYKEGQLYEQTVQLMRIRAIRMYFELREDYPKYIGDREEVDFIKKRMKSIKIQTKYLKKTSQELFLNRAFLNQKLARVYSRKKKVKRMYNELAQKDYQKALNYGKFTLDEKEEIIDILDILANKLKRKKK